MSPAGLICGRVVVADCKTRLVLLLEGILLFGTMMSGGSSDSVACCWSAAGSFSFVALHRPAYTRFLAARKRGLGDGGIARQERTGPSVSIEMMVDAGDAAVVASAGRERSQAAQAYYERKRQSLSAWSEERRGRDLCERCRRARKMCLCSSLPARAMPTSTRFVILQHPAETKKRITGTVPLVLHCLSNCRRIVMRSDFIEDELRRALGVGAGAAGDGEGEGGAGEHLPERSSSSSERSSEGATSAPLLLFPCPGAEYLEDVAAAARENPASSAPPPPPPERTTAPPISQLTAPSPTSSPGPVVVLIDGTWSQAKQILSRYPFLSPQQPSVAGPGGRGLKFSSLGGAPATGGPFNPGQGGGGGGGGNQGAEETGAGVRGYAAEEVGVGGVGQEGGREEEESALCRAVKFRSAGVSSYGFRREPTKECLSTLESVAYTLEVLEGTPEGASAAAYLRKAFSAMVAMQLEAADESGGRPRFVNRKGRTANRNSTPPRKRVKDGGASGTRR